MRRQVKTTASLYILAFEYIPRPICTRRRVLYYRL